MRIVQRSFSSADRGDGKLLAPAGGAYAIDKEIDDLEAVLSHSSWGNRPLVVVGHSESGLTAVGEPTDCISTSSQFKGGGRLRQLNCAG